MKKVVIFSLAYYPSFVSGAEAAVKEITERIDDVEFHVITHLFDTSAPREEKLGATVVHRVGFGNAYISKILFVPLAAIKARSLEKKMGIDAVWCMMTYMLLPLVCARMIGLRAPHVLTLQDGDPYEKVFKRWFIVPFTPLLDYGFRTASNIQVISKYLAQWPGKKGYTGNIELIHNGANPRDLHESVSEEEIKAVQNKFGKKEEDVWLVNTARLVHQKAFDDTIRALSNLPGHVRFLVVGGGEDEAMLKSLVQELGLSERVIFVGPVDRSEVTIYRKASDIFVMPSRSEGLGNAGLSAMASKLPVVATQEGGLAEFVFDAKHNPDEQPTAWVVEKDSPEQIAAAVQEILSSPEDVTQRTETARAMVLEKYDWDMVAKEMKEKIFTPVFEK